MLSLSRRVGCIFHPRPAWFASQLCTAWAADNANLLASPFCLLAGDMQSSCFPLLLAGDPDVPPELGPLQAWLDPHWRTLHAALAAVENTRSWAGLTPLVSAALSVEAEAERAGQVLGSCHPAVRQFLDGIGLDWGFALGAAYTRERMLWYFAMQGAPGAKLSDRLLEFGIARPKLRRAPCAAASESGRCEPSKQGQRAQQAAAAVAGWVPAGAGIVTASFEGWVRMTRALGL